jgi:hypothetical protein
MVFVNILPYLILVMIYVIGCIIAYILGATRSIVEKKQEEPEIRDTSSPVLASLHTLESSATNLAVLAKQLIEMHREQVQKQAEYQNE